MSELEKLLATKNNQKSMQNMSMEEMVRDIKKRDTDIAKKNELVSLLEAEYDKMIPIDTILLLRAIDIDESFLIEGVKSDTLDTLDEPTVIEDIDNKLKIGLLTLLANNSVANQSKDDLPDELKKSLLVLLANNTVSKDLKKSLLILLAKKNQEGGGYSNTQLIQDVKKIYINGGATGETEDTNLNTERNIFSKEIQKNIKSIRNHIKETQFDDLGGKLLSKLEPLMESWCEKPKQDKNDNKKERVILDNLILYDEFVNKLTTKVTIEKNSLFDGIYNPSEIDDKIKHILEKNLDKLKNIVVNETHKLNETSMGDKDTLQEINDKLTAVQNIPQYTQYTQYAHNYQNDIQTLSIKLRQAKQDESKNLEFVKNLNKIMKEEIKKINTLEKNPVKVDVDYLINLTKQNDFEYCKKFILSVLSGTNLNNDKEYKNGLNESLDQGEKRIVYNLLSIGKPQLKFTELFTKILKVLQFEDVSKIKHIILLLELLDELSKLNTTENNNKLIYFKLLPFAYLLDDASRSLVLYENYKLNDPKKFNKYDVITHEILNKTKGKGIKKFEGTNNIILKEINDLLDHVDTKYTLGKKEYTKDLDEETLTTINKNMYLKMQIINMISFLKKRVMDMFDYNKLPLSLKHPNAVKKISYGIGLATVGIPTALLFSPIVGLVTAAGVAGVSAGINKATVNKKEGGSLTNRQMLGGADLKQGGILFNGKDINELSFTNVSYNTNKIYRNININQLIRNNRENYLDYRKYNIARVINKEYLPQWIGVLENKIPNGYVVNQALHGLIFNYWINKLENDIKRLEEINSNKTDFASDKFGDISFRKALRSLTGLRQRIINYGLKDLLPGILSMTNRIMNNRSFKPDKFNKITDDKIKQFLYMLEPNTDLRKELLIVNPSLESKLMEFIRLLKSEDEKKQQAKLEKEKQETQKELDAKNRKEEQKKQAIQSKLDKDKKDNLTMRKSSKDIDSNKRKSNSNKELSQGSPGDKDSSNRDQAILGEMNQGQVSEGQVSEGQMDQGQTEDSTGEIIPGKVSKEYPALFTSDVNNQYVPSNETEYTPLQSEKSLLSVNSLYYNQLLKDRDELLELLKEERLSNSNRINQLKKQLKFAFDNAESKIENEKNKYIQIALNNNLLKKEMDKLKMEKENMKKMQLMMLKHANNLKTQKKAILNLKNVNMSNKKTQSKSVGRRRRKKRKTVKKQIKQKQEQNTLDQMIDLMS